VFGPLDAWLLEHLYAVVLLGAVVDAIGIPFPGRILLITVGSFSGARPDAEASAAIVIALATCGTVAGDHVWYFLGRLKGRRLFDLYFRLVRLPESNRKAADRFLRQYGSLALVLARLAATFRVVLVPLAVSRGMSYRRFLAFDALGAFLWSASFIGLGWAVGAISVDGGMMATLAAIGVLAAGSMLMGVMMRRRLSGRARVS
jgi:membrane protein DedA with SNARE-associated domain